jgi:hypothetical protein
MSGAGPTRGVREPERARGAAGGLGLVGDSRNGLAATGGSSVSAVVGDALASGVPAAGNGREKDMRDWREPGRIIGGGSTDTLAGIGVGRVGVGGVGSGSGSRGAAASDALRDSESEEGASDSEAGIPSAEGGDATKTGAGIGASEGEGSGRSTASAVLVSSEARVVGEVGGDSVAGRMVSDCEACARRRESALGRVGGDAFRTGKSVELGARVVPSDSACSASGGPAGSAAVDAEAPSPPSLLSRRSPAFFDDARRFAGAGCVQSSTSSM